MKILWITCFAIIASVSSLCPPAPKELGNFKMNRIPGLWFKMATTTPYGGNNYKCNKAYNILYSDQKSINVTTYNYDYYNGPETLDWFGEVYQTPSGVYKNSLHKTDGKSAPYFVYYTDNYATLQIIYACPEDNGVKADKPIIWIQSRFCRFSEKLFKKALDKLKAIPDIDSIQWNQFGSAKCCAPKSQSSSPSS